MPLTFKLALLAVATAAAPALAQTAPADSTLAAITARGRMLQQYDIAAWHGGDAIMALHPQPGEVTTSIATRNPDGSWLLNYGRLSAKKDIFYVTYRATQVDADSSFTAARFSTPLPQVGTLREMAVAMGTGTQQFGRVNRLYNSYIVPAPAGGYWVYFLPAQTSSQSFPLGGDIRYRIIHGTTIVDSARFHRTILERVTGKAQSGGTQVASGHTSFDSLPSETDVFVVLRQFPRLPELVATRNFAFQIDIDGTITWVRAAQTNGAIAPPPPPPAAVPVRTWTATIDRVGSAPRTMSPGYTAWRDTTTGWRMTFDRIAPIHGADSGSYSPAWHALMLVDGQMLVTRQFPLSPVQLYDADGHFVREIGRPGSGPGEFMSTPTLATKGDTLIAFDGIESRVSLFALDGQLIRSFVVNVRGAPIPIGVDPRGYLRIEQRYGLGYGDTLSRKQWLYYTTRGALVDSLRRPVLPAPRSWHLLDGTRVMNFAVPLSPAVADVFLPDGTLMYGVGDRYQFFVTRTGRDTVRIFGRSDLVPIPVPSGFVDTTINDLARGQPLVRAVAHRADFPATFPMWNTATVDDKGFVWVSSGLNGRTPAQIGIFGPDGRFLGGAPLWWEKVDQMSFGADRMVVVGWDKDRRPVLRIYKVDRRGM
ncbi:MAG TPA: 6-bladed beta-propeller [Gemmatimonadales bacterium]|jgi:hypothetical protein